MAANNLNYAMKMSPTFPRGSIGDMFYHTGKSKTYVFDGNWWVEVGNAKLTLAPIDIGED